MNIASFSLGYEGLYQERLNETKSMITLATLLDFLDQGIDNNINYRFVMNKAHAIAESANHDGLPSDTPDVSLVASVIRSNVKIMIYNIIEFSVTNLIQAIYDRLDEEDCGYIDVSEKLRTLWHHTRMRSLRDPNANHATAERISKELLDEAVSNVAVSINARQTLTGGNLDGEEILKLFNKHGVFIHAAKSSFSSNELKDIKDRRNGLAHGSISFTEVGNQVTTAELANLLEHVDSFLTQLRLDVINYLNSGEYKASKAV